MSDETTNRWFIGIAVTAAFSVVAMFVGWNTWMTLQIVSHGATITQLSMARDNVIPEVVEKSLSELRHKTNEQYEASSSANQRLLEIANQNRIDIRDVQKDVSQIKELLSKKSP